MGEPARRRSAPLLLAHRGVHVRAAENSLAAIEAAVAHPGLDGVEFDVRHAADGTPIVLHDATLTRVQRWPVAAASLPVGVLGGFGVPTLAAVLAACPRHAFLDIELKEAPTPATVAVIRAARGAGPGLDHAIISAFESEALVALRALEPAWPCWLNVEGRLDGDVVAAARRLACVGISADASLLDETAAALVRGAGLALAAWTVRDPRTLGRVVDLGVDLICVEGAALPGPAGPGHTPPAGSA